MTDFNGPEHVDWWARREEAYQQRPDVQAETRRILAEIRQERDDSAAYEAGLEGRIAQGDPRAQQLLNEELTRQAYETDPALPSAEGDPAEWEAFFRHFYGQDMPANAFYQARLYDVEADAPPDVGGLRAAYDEQPWNDLTDEAAAADDEMEAWRRGIPLQQLQEEYRAAAAREKAEEYDRFGLPAELWLRSLPESAEAGPYEPAEALARFQAGRAGGLSQAVLFRTSDGTLSPLIGLGGHQQFTVYGWVQSAAGNDHARRGRASRTWTGAVLGEDLTWHDAVAVAERASRLPPASYASVESISGKPVFQFADGNCVGPGFPLPEGQPGTPAEELARLMTADAGPARSADPYQASPSRLDFPKPSPLAAVDELLRRVRSGSGRLASRTRAARPGRPKGPRA